MLRIIDKIITFSIRRVKSVNKITQQSQINPKIRFTEQQMTQMSDYHRKNDRRSLAEIYADKYKQQQQQKQQSFNDQDQTISNKIHHKQNRSNLHEKMMKFKVNQLRNRLARADQSQQLTSQQKARIRLDPQYLPMEYLLKVQKIFHKYDQSHLREIASHFSNLMKLRYSQDKIDYQLYGELKFQKLQQKIPTNKQIQPLYLVGRSTIYEEKKYQNPRKIDEDPIDSSINYTQNIVISYLLNRVPRTFATAVRIFTEIKYKYPTFKPISMVDFGSGLSSGSCAFVDIFGDTGSVYNVDPASKMRKMSKYLTDYTKIQHFQTLGALSTEIGQVDIVYCGYVLSQIRSYLVEVYLQALYTKVSPEGFLIIVQYGNPFGARIIHQIRKWALQNTDSIIAGPCPHHNKCPLRSQIQWCHFDQPAGMYPKQVFGRLPTDNDVKLQKFSYIVLQKQTERKQILQESQTNKIKPNITHQWDRVLFPVMKRGRHILLNLCTTTGKFQRRIVAKSHGEQYKQGRRLRWGDLWRFGKRIPNRYRKQRKTGKRLW